MQNSTTPAGSDLLEALVEGLFGAILNHSAEGAEETTSETPSAEDAAILASADASIAVSKAILALMAVDSMFVRLGKLPIEERTLAATSRLIAETLAKFIDTFNGRSGFKADMLTLFDLAAKLAVDPVLFASQEG